MYAEQQKNILFGCEAQALTGKCPQPSHNISHRLLGLCGGRVGTKDCRGTYRYLGLSHTWRKFFCVLSPREKVPGCPVDMQLLIFSKNGFDPVSSIWMTDAAPIEVPLKAAHGRACYELVWLSTLATQHRVFCVFPEWTAAVTNTSLHDS